MKNSAFQLTNSAGPTGLRSKEMTNGEFLARSWIVSGQLGNDSKAPEKIFARILGKPVQPSSVRSGLLSRDDENVLVVEMTASEYNKIRSKDDPPILPPIE